MRLKDEHKSLIVKRYAQFRKAPEIRDELRDEHGVEVHTNQIYLYDPTGKASKRISKKWLRLYAEERQKYVSEDAAQDIQLYHMTERIRELQDIYFRLKELHPLGATSVLEQIAKEQGQAYTNRALMEAAGNTGEPTGDSYTQINNYFNMEAPKGPVDSKQIKEAK